MTMSDDVPTRAEIETLFAAAARGWRPPGLPATPLDFAVCVLHGYRDENVTATYDEMGRLTGFNGLSLK